MKGMTSDSRRPRWDRVVVGAIAILVLSCAAEERMSSVQTALESTTITGYVNTSTHWDLSPSIHLDFGPDQILTGLWIGLPTFSPSGVIGTNLVTLTAYSGDFPLASLAIHLRSTTPVFWDTSSFLYLSNVTHYTMAPTDMDAVYFPANNFQLSPLSIAEFCPCEGPWRNHQAYVRCVGVIVAGLTEEGVLTRTQAKDLLKQAHQTDREIQHPQR